MTLLDPIAAKARASEKQRKLLRFLRINKWTNQETVQALLGLRSRQAAHKTLSRLAGDDLIRKHRIELYPGKCLSIWGITVHGVMMSFGDHEPIKDARAFELSKFSTGQAQHQLGLQQIQIRLEAAGWHGWSREKRRNRQDVVPDAIVMHPHGWPVAIEYERSLKALRRYETILAGHLSSRKNSLYREIYYIAPNDALCARILRIFKSIKSLRYKGERFPVTQEHLAPFHFYSLSSRFEGFKD